MKVPMTTRVLLLVLLAVLAVNCKPRHAPMAESKATTKIESQYLDLTTYKANGSSLTNLEVDAIKKYSSEDPTNNGQKYYKRLNRALRQFIQKDIDFYDGIIKNASSGINKLRNGSCTFYRYIDADQDLANQMMRTGQTYIERGFFSTTKNNRAPKGFENKQHVIIGTSSQCADVSSYSRIPSEREVLFPPGSEFKVTRDFDGRYFYLEEIAPGNGKSPNSAVGTLGSEASDDTTLAAGGGDIESMVGTFRSAKGSLFEILGEGKYRYKWWQYNTYSNIASVQKISSKSVRIDLGGNQWFQFDVLDEDRLNSTWYGGGASVYSRNGASNAPLAVETPQPAAQPLGNGGVCPGDRPVYVGTASNTKDCFKLADQKGIHCLQVRRLGANSACCCSR